MVEENYYKSEMLGTNKDTSILYQLYLCTRNRFLILVYDNNNKSELVFLL